MPLLVEGAKFHEVWDGLLLKLMGRPLTVSPRGMATREICGVSIHIEDLLQNILVNTGRDLNYRFMVAEFLWIALGRRDVASLMQFNKNIAKFSDDGKTLYGAYGPRIRPQLERVTYLLKKDQDTRQAVIDIFGTNMSTTTKDVPCTLSFQFFIRQNKLCCIVTMRSSDVWLGLPYDFYSFSQLTNALAGELNVETGWLQMNLGSSHLYESNQDAAAQCTGWNSYTLPSRRLLGWPDEVLDFALREPNVPLSEHVGWETQADSEAVRRFVEVLQQPT